jgi:hypothetical protein
MISIGRGVPKLYVVEFFIARFYWITPSDLNVSNGDLFPSPVVITATIASPPSDEPLYD